jgi:L-glyceraldehyde 3-phosphate reductase
MTGPIVPAYDRMPFRRAGRTGVLLPAISLGLWQNFGSVDPYERSRAIVRRAFELGITHYDLANNYGPEPGSAEETFGRILRQDFGGRRDELVISTKAGYRMWAGPYGDGGSRKYLLASLDQSLERMGLEYVDVFYHHRPDAATPLEESMLALDHAVRQGKALYAGLSNYDAEQTAAALGILRELRTPVLLHQPKYSMYERSRVEGALLDTLERAGVGCIVFSPLAQGLLTDVPPDSRAGKPGATLSASSITPERRAQLRALNDVAAGRGQSLAQLALAWVLRHRAVTSALIGASRVEQLEQNVAALENLALSSEELATIDAVLGRET